MCGVAGAVGRIEPDLIQAVHAAVRAQRHRGPDDEGGWQSADPGHDGAMLGFRRLAIIDLSMDAHQPMIDPSTGNVIAFNGEIYNFLELRRELESLGDSFRSRSDTEVILRAYARWGKGALTRLRGMFAIAIWDARQRRVLLARDRVGIKPLYLCTIERAGGRKVVLFASELRALLATGLVPRRLCLPAIGSYIWNGFVVGPETIIEGVHLLSAGTIVTVDPASGAFQSEQYWHLPDEHPTADGVERLQHELESAVRQQLVSDVVLGVFLSGGVDSSAITAVAARAVNGRRIRTFNIAFDEAGYDEAPYAKRVAEALDTEHIEVRLTQGRFLEQMEDALHCLDQPTFDAMNTYFVSRAAREAGLTVALSGAGGDELFGGYRSFSDIPRASRMSRLLRLVPQQLLRIIAGGIVRARFGRFGDVPPQTRWGKLGDVLATRGHLVDLYQTAYSLFTADFAHQLFAWENHGELLWGLPRSRCEELIALTGHASPLHAISVLELANFVGERLLRDTDAASMAVSLETRVPFLDHKVIEAAAHVPEIRRFEPLGRKKLLREIAMPGLDDAWFDRPKAGFVIPLDVWARQRLAGEIESTLCNRDRCAACGLNPDAVARLWRAFAARAPGLYWSRIWAMFALMWWAREHRASV